MTIDAPNEQATPFSLVFTKKAAVDLDGLFAYISHQLYAPKAAKNLMRKIEKSILRLTQFPYMAAPCKDALLSKRGYRALCVNNHVMVYRVNDKKKTVTVHRVFYGKTNYAKLM
ncbi:MAG: type II toxin-antitoxin system RelE/ParE family toxin [Ruthenibacterium sp.]